MTIANVVKETVAGSVAFVGAIIDTVGFENGFVACPARNAVRVTPGSQLHAADASTNSPLS